MRILATVALLGIVLLVIVPSAEARGGRHPYFDDRGTLTWYETMAEAQAAARREGKIILVEFGRLRCSQCRVLCSTILPDSRVRTRLSKVAVGLAADCDRPEPQVDAMFRRRLPCGNMLPFVGFLKADGTWITGYAGSTSVDRFLAHLAQAERCVSQPCTPQPRTSQPRTSQPRTSQPRTSQPRTSQPRTSQPYVRRHQPYVPQVCAPGGG